ncbi:kinase [Microbacteriaceae bacterium 4G12]
MENNVVALLEIVKNRCDNRFVLGIDGLSRSGKTTLVNKLSQNLQGKFPLYIFHIDDHIVERKKRYHTGYEEWYEYYNLQWDIDWLRENFFGQLRDANQLTLPFYDSASDTQILKNVTLPNRCVIIVEGVFLQRKEWRNFYDFVVYLDCPREKRFLRESDNTQKQLTKFENRYWKAEEFYLNTELPEENANLVLKG